MNTYNVVPYNIMITLLCEEFDRKASHIADSVCATLFTSSGAQTEQNGSFLSNTIQEFG